MECLIILEQVKTIEFTDFHVFDWSGQSIPFLLNYDVIFAEIPQKNGLLAKYDKEFKLALSMGISVYWILSESSNEESIKMLFEIDFLKLREPYNKFYLVDSSFDSYFKYGLQFHWILKTTKDWLPIAYLNNSKNGIAIKSASDFKEFIIPIQNAGIEDTINSLIQINNKKQNLFYQSKHLIVIVIMLLGFAITIFNLRSTQEKINNDVEFAYWSSSSFEPIVARYETVNIPKALGFSIDGLKNQKKGLKNIELYEATRLLRFAKKFQLSWLESRIIDKVILDYPESDLIIDYLHGLLQLSIESLRNKKYEQGRYYAQRVLNIAQVLQTNSKIKTSNQLLSKSRRIVSLCTDNFLYYDTELITIVTDLISRENLTELSDFENYKPLLKVSKNESHLTEYLEYYSQVSRSHNHIMRRNYNEAVRQWDKFLKLNKSSQMRDEAWFNKINNLLDNGYVNHRDDKEFIIKNNLNVILELDLFLKEYPNSYLSDDALLQKLKCLEWLNKDKTDEYFVAFKMLLTDYKNSDSYILGVKRITRVLNKILKNRDADYYFSYDKASEFLDYLFSMSDDKIVDNEELRAKWFLDLAYFYTPESKNFNSEIRVKQLIKDVLLGDTNLYYP